MSVLQRIPNQEGKAGAPAAAADSVRRREDEQRGAERSARFRAALGQRDAQAQSLKDDRKDARLTRQEIDATRSEERCRDRAAAAEVLGRLGLDQDAVGDRQSAGAARPEGAAAVAPEASAPGHAVNAAEPGGPSSSPASAGAAQAGRPEGAPAGEVPPEVAAIENAVERVIESDAEASPTAAAGLEAVPTALPWARPEGPARPEAPRQLPAPPPGTEAYHRLLMGQGPAGAEARLTITQGPLAGLQIQLTNGPRGVQAAVLTQGSSSRQTLLSAMDQVAQRLRQKGHNIELKFGGAGPAGGLPPRRG